MSDRASIEARTQLLEVEAAARRAASAASNSQTGSLTVRAASYQIVGIRKQATGTERITVEGTGRLRIMN